MATPQTYRDVSCTLVKQTQSKPLVDWTKTFRYIPPLVSAEAMPAWYLLQTRESLPVTPHHLLVPKAVEPESRV